MGPLQCMALKVTCSVWLLQLKQLEEELQAERRLTKEAKEQINSLQAQLDQAKEQQVCTSL